MKAASWSLPPIPSTNAANDPVMNLARDLSCGAGGWSRIATLDMDGDGHPELLQTDDCVLGGAGLTHWNVYPHACSFD